MVSSCATMHALPASNKFPAADHGSSEGKAMLLACCRQAEFLGEATPAELRARIASVNDEVAAAVRQFARVIDRPLLACRLALIAYPLGAVRLYLPASPIPKELDAEIIKVARVAFTPRF
jgi:hypothetical protein